MDEVQDPPRLSLGGDEVARLLGAGRSELPVDADLASLAAKLGVAGE